MDYNYRSFLNPDEGLAAIEVVISGGDVKDKYIDIDLKISDCSRMIDLEFGVWIGTKNEDEISQVIDARMQKANRIIAALEQIKYNLFRFKEQFNTA